MNGPDSLTRDAFEDLVGERFILKGDDEPVEAVLAEVSPLPGAVEIGRDRAFSLLLRTPDGDGLRQGIYALEHEHLGTISLFLVPIGPIEGGHGLEAVFNS